MSSKQKKKSRREQGSLSQRPRVETFVSACTNEQIGRKSGENRERIGEIPSANMAELNRMLKNPQFVARMKRRAKRKEDYKYIIVEIPTDEDEKWLIWYMDDGLPSLSNIPYFDRNPNTLLLPYHCHLAGSLCPPGDTITQHMFEKPRPRDGDPSNSKDTVLVQYKILARLFEDEFSYTRKNNLITSCKFKMEFP